MLGGLEFERFHFGNERFFPYFPRDGEFRSTSESIRDKEGGDNNNFASSTRRVYREERIGQMVG